MQTGKITLARTNAATQFRSALVQDAGAPLSLDVNNLGVGVRVDSILRSIAIVSQQDLAYELWFYAKSTMNGGPLADIQFRGWWQFAVSGRQIADLGLYYFYIEGLQIPLADLDNTGKIHMVLINRSAAAKLADDAGAVQVQFGLEMALGV